MLKRPRPTVKSVLFPKPFDLRPPVEFIQRIRHMFAIQFARKFHPHIIDIPPAFPPVSPGQAQTAHLNPAHSSIAVRNTAWNSKSGMAYDSSHIRHCGGILYAGQSWAGMMKSVELGDEVPRNILPAQGAATAASDRYRVFTLTKAAVNFIHPVYCTLT